MRRDSIYAFTENLKSIVTDRVTSLGSYYCREDFERALISYLADSKEDNREFRRQELEELCLARGLDTEALLREFSDLAPVGEHMEPWKAEGRYAAAQSDREAARSSSAYPGSANVRQRSRAAEGRRKAVMERIRHSTVLQEVPTRKKLEEELLKMFHDLFGAFHSPADYMKRIVHNLAEEYDVEREPVRVIILKKFLKGGLVNDAPYKTGDILKKLRDSLDENTRRTYDKLKKKDRAAFLVPYINDAVFENIPKFTAADEFRVLAAILRECVEGGLLAEEAIRLRPENERALRQLLSEDGTGNLPGDSGEAQSPYRLIQSAAEALACGSLCGESVISRIEAFFRSLEKDLTEQMERVSYRTRSGKTARVSEKYFEKKKTEKDKITDSWRLLRVCNDLAAGRFHPNGQTRRELYHFAILFDMSYYFEEEKKNNAAYEKNRDMEKNLFQDYYNDNLLRILATSRTVGEADTSIEPEASGEGINYKNYAECIYLYYIRHKESSVPGERLKAAEDMIRQCGNTKPEKPVRTTRWGYTREQREDNFRILMRLDVKDIPQFVAAHYVVDKNADKITLATEQFSAFDMSSMLIEATANAHAGGMTAMETEAYRSGIRARGANAEDARKWEEEKRQLESSRPSWNLKWRLEEKYGDDKNFMAVVSSLQERLREIRAGRFNAVERKQLSWVLGVLAPCEYPEAAHVTLEDIQRRIDRNLKAERKDAWEAEDSGEWNAALEEKPIDAKKAIGALNWLGFEIECEGDRYYLRPGKNRKSDGLEKQREMILADAMEGTWDSLSDRKMRNLMIHRMRYSDRVTRNELLALYFDYFTAELQQDPEEDERDFWGEAAEKEDGMSVSGGSSYGYSKWDRLEWEEHFADEMDIDQMRDVGETLEWFGLFDVDRSLLNNFQKLFDKFREGADILLDEARYQRFSEKNILDMYLLTELYFFAAENCSYMGYLDEVTYSPEIG